MSPLANLLTRGKDATGATEDVADLTAPRLTVVARVNLLPPEIADAERFRREQVVRGGALVAAIAIIAVGAVGASNQVSRAQEAVDVTTARSAALSAEVASLADVPRTAAALQTAQTQRTGALGQEVRWSVYLNNLGLLTPGSTQLQTMSVVQTVDPTKSATGSGAAGPVSPLGTPGIAAVTFGGITKSNDDLAFFLESQAKQVGNIDPYFTNAQRTLDSSTKREVITFASTVTVTSAAQSGRYSKSGE